MTNDSTNERTEFTAAMREAGYDAPEINGRGDAYLYQRDQDRFVGWQLARAALSQPSPAVPNLRARLGEAHDASLDGNHRGCRDVLMDCISELDAASQPTEPAQPATQVASVHLVQAVDYAIHHGWPLESRDALARIRAADIKRAEQPATQAGAGHLFELWWAAHMPDATQASAWAAWQDAPRADGVGVDAPTTEQPGDAEDAARWRMLPAFLGDYQINYVGLIRDIDAAIAARAAHGKGGA